MILAVDIGNSNIVIGGMEGEKILFAAMAQMASDPERCQKWAEKATVRSWCFDFEAAYQGFSAVIDQ